MPTLAFEAVIKGQPTETGTELAKQALGDGALLAEEGTESMTFYLTAWTLALYDRLGGFGETQEPARGAGSQGVANGLYPTIRVGLPHGSSPGLPRDPLE